MTPLPIADGDDGAVTPLTSGVSLKEDVWLEPLLQLSSMMLLSQSSDEGLLASEVVVILQNDQSIKLWMNKYASCHMDRKTIANI